MVVVKAVFPKGVQSDPVTASFAGAEQRKRAEGDKEELGWSGQVGWVQVLATGGTVRAQSSTVPYYADPTEQVPTR